MCRRFVRRCVCLLLCVLLLPVYGALAAPAALTLNHTALTLALGSTTFLRASVEGVTWSSDAPEIAAVNAEGAVSGLAAGTAHIVAAAGGSAALCTVTVTDAAAPPVPAQPEAPAVPVTGVELLLPTDETVANSFQLGAKVLPLDASNQAVTWLSSDPAVAVVDQTGHVTLTGVGTATITVTTQDGGFTDSRSITAKSSAVAVAGISLGRSYVQLAAGSTAFLTVTLIPEDATNQAVTWQSANPAVAMVSEVGAITAVAAGKTEVSAVTADGGFSASCTVLVPPDNGAVAVTGVLLNHASLALDVGGKSTLLAGVQPLDATVQTILWVSSDPAVVTVDDAGLVTAVGPGAATVTAVAAGGSKAACKVEVSAAPQPPDIGVYTTGDDTQGAFIPALAELETAFGRTAAYSGFTDVAESAWYGTGNQGVVRTAVELGIMNGYTDGSFVPEDNIKLSEAIKMAAVVHDLYNGGDGAFEKTEPWYDAYVTYAVRYGIIKDTDFADYARSATRAEMAYIFCNALPERYLPRINSSVEISDVALLSSQTVIETPYAFQIYYLYQAGVLTGDNAETRAFRPGDNIIRAEAAAIISRICLPDMRILFEA